MNFLQKFFFKKRKEKVSKQNITKRNFKNQQARVSFLLLMKYAFFKKRKNKPTDFTNVIL